MGFEEQWWKEKELIPDSPNENWSIKRFPDFHSENFCWYIAGMRRARSSTFTPRSWITSGRWTSRRESWVCSRSTWRRGTPLSNQAWSLIQSCRGSAVDPGLTIRSSHPAGNRKNLECRSKLWRWCSMLCWNPLLYMKMKNTERYI